MDWLDVLTRALSDGLRSLGARYPTLIAVSISAGFLTKIIIHTTSQIYQSPIFQSLDGYDWYVYAAITNGLFLLPSAFGKSRVPDIVLAQIAAVKKIMDESSMSPQNRSLFWSNFLGKFIRETTISTELPSPEQTIKEPTHKNAKHGISKSE